MRSLRRYMAAGILLWLPGTAALAARTGGVAEGQLVTLKLPAVFLSKGRSGLLETRTAFVVDIVQRAGVTTPSGAADWQRAGFPSLMELTVKNVRKRRDQTEVELQNKESVVRLRFLSGPPDLDAAFWEIAVPGPASGPAARRYLEESYRGLAGAFFQGALAKLSDDRKLQLVRVAHAAGSDVAFDRKEYKGRTYLVARLGAWTYPAFPINVLARVARAFNDRLLTLSKELGRAIHGEPGYFGVELELSLVRATPTASSSAAEDVRGDRVEWFAPADRLWAFSEDEISGQQLLDGSVLLVDGNRSELALASWK